jgi:xylulose-5-phosphate/fructose-6-phosphate phosphoketolase
MCVLNHMDRYQLALDVIKRVPRLSHLTAEASQKFTETRQKHKLYVSQYGEDLPEVRDWRWGGVHPGADVVQDTGGDN